MTRSRDQALGGEIATDVAHQLAEPLRGLRDRLGLLVDHLERHVATSRGPAPYPWRSLQSLRQDLGAAYLEATQLARRLDELERALQVAGPDWFELAAAVDLGLRLAAHHLTATGGHPFEQLFDLGSAPPVRGVPGTLALIVAQLVGVCARSARAAAGSTLTVRVWSEEGAGIVTIADNGTSDPQVDEAGETARVILAGWGATIDAAAAAGKGCAFELHLATER